MNCNILAQRKQHGREILPQLHLSMIYLTTVIAASLVTLSGSLYAQTTAGGTSDTNLSELIHIGAGQTSKKDYSSFYSTSQTVGVWVDGGHFVDAFSGAGGSSVHSPAIFQIGGSKLYDKGLNQGSPETSLGGSIRFNALTNGELFSKELPKRRPDVSIVVLGSSNTDAIFSANQLSLNLFPEGSINFYIDGNSGSRKTSVEIDDSFRLGRNTDETGGKLSFVLKNSSSFSCGGDASFAFTDKNDSFIIRDNSTSDTKKSGIIVGGNFSITNSATLPQDISKKSKHAIISNTDLQVGGTFGLFGGHGFNVGDSSFLQVINDTGVNAAISASAVYVYSDQPDNTTTLLLGHGAKVNAEKYVFIYSAPSSRSQLFLGDTSSTDENYGLTTAVVILDHRSLNNKIVFSNAHRGNSAETASFTIQGYGTVDVQSGRTILSEESTYSGKTNIASGAALILKTISSAGTSDISNSGELSFSGGQGTIQNNISGSGSVVFEDDANVYVQNNATWTGPTTINKAAVTLGSESRGVDMASSSVNISKDGKLIGFGSINGSLNNAGFFMVGDNENASPSDFNIGRNIVNSGEIHLGNGKSAGSSLIVHGNYTGNNGLLEFNTILNGDNDSPSDRLVIKGDTSGDTSVRVNALGGSGKQTNTGIELIHVDGASEGSFTQEGRIVAGAYEYELERGTGDNNKNWYLKSHLIKDKGQHGRTGPSPDQDEIPLYRPEAGAYVGNSAVVQTLFSSRLHDRIGDLWYADPYAENNQLTGMWIKQRGNYNTWRESSGQTRNRTQMYATQIGADVASWTSNGENRFLVGWVAGYGHGRTKSRSIHTGYHAIGTVDGLNVGITGTWYQDGIHHEGMYVDTWFTYGWFDNKVKGQGIETEKYHSRGFTGSLETGYTWKLGEHVTEKGCDIGWFLQPQAQVIWSGVKTDTFHEHNGTAVKSKGRNNIQTRLGARLMLDTNLRSYANGIGGTQFFIEGNWVHNTKSHGVEMNGTVLNQEGARHLGEIKVGLNGKPTDNLHIWTNVTARAGTHHYRDLTGMIGLKYSF